MALTRIKTNQITDLAVTNAKIANATIAGGKLANNLTYGSDLTVSGNLTVSGTTVSVSTTNTRVDDAILALASGTSGSPSEDAGILINRGSSDNQAFLWDESADQFVLANVGSEDGDTAGDVTISSYAGLQAGAIIYGSLNDGTTTLTSTAAELNLIDGSSAGTIVNSKAVIYGASGEVNATTLQIGGTSITATAAEINALDGITSTVTELNIVDGNTSATATTVASGDRVVYNDAGTMVQVDVDDIDTYFSGTTKTLTNKTLTSPTINSATIAMGTNKITGLGDPTANQDAATKAYVDTQTSTTTTVTDGSASDTFVIGDTITFTPTSNETTVAVTTGGSGPIVTIGLPDDVTVSNDLTVTGNLTVNGTTTTLSTTNSVVSDSLIELNNGAASNANDLGFIMERGSTGDNAAIIWDESVDAFVFGTTTATGASTGDLTVTKGAIESATINTTGTATLNDVTVGGGFGSTGVTISAAGVIQANGAISSDGAITGGSITDGTATFSSGALTGATTGSFSSNLTVNGNIDISGGSGTITTNVSDTQILFSSSGVISGAATLVWDGTDLTAGSAKISDLTSGRVVLAGTSGAIEDSGNLTFNGSTLAVTGSITASSNVDIADAGSLRVGTGNDFTINHDGTNTTITNGTGILAIDGLATSSIRINEAGANVDFVVEGDTNTALLTVDASGDNVGIGGAPNANAVFHVNDTGAMILPAGTTVQRPGTPVMGMFRYNTTGNTIEYYDNNSWETISTDFTVATSQTFNGDDTTTDFTLSALTGADSYTVAGVLVMLNGVVQEPTTVYGITGTTLSFTTAPATGDLIEVRKFTTTTTVTSLSDVDGDTLVLVEHTSDDDTIRFKSAGTEIANVAAGGLTLNAQSDLRFADSDSSNWVAFQAPATISSNVTWTLPSADAGVSGYALVSDGAGTLSFAAAGATTTLDETTNANEQIYFGDITSGAVTALHHDSGLTYNPSTGTLTSATFSGALSGNATTATALETARTIALSGDVTGSASFDGSGNITITTTAQANSVALGTDTTGNYVAAGATSGNGLSGSVSSEGGTFTVTSNATSANTANTIVFRDASGNFSAGTVTATATSAQYADLAEMYAADEAIEPGTVVHFAGDGKVAACDTANCRAVAGIISTDPAHLMNSAQEGVALALAGRVPCKVTGPVAAGDLMVSAGNGMAMANNEAALGTVIGKAIEANEDGEGVIEVLALMM